MWGDPDKPIIGLYYESENDVLKWSTIALQSAFEKHNLPFLTLDLRKQEDFSELYNRLQTGRCAFCLSYQGIGSQLRVGETNLWTKAQKPLIALHYDHPCHRIENHLTPSPYIMNLYAFGSHKQAYDTYVAPLTGAPRLSGSLPFNCKIPPASPAPYNQREIPFLYVKTGLSLDLYIDHFNTLPTQWRDGAYDIIARAGRNPNLSLCDCVANLFPAERFHEPDMQVEYWALVKAIDLYLRAERAITFVEWLKMQDGAVIIGGGWDAIDKKHARANFRPAMHSHLVIELYTKSQFVCNTNPYGSDIIHERTAMGLLSGTCVLSDSNAWWDSHFPALPSLIHFDYTSPLEEQLRPQLDTPPEAPLVAQKQAEIISYFESIDMGTVIIGAAEQLVQWTKRLSVS